MWARSVLVLAGLSLLACGKSEEAKSATAVSSADSPALTKSVERLDDSMAVIDKMGERLPPEVARRARCVIVVPNMVKGGLIVGARHGDGFATCREGSAWSAPAPLTISGGSFGAQVGVESLDLVMVVMNDDGKQKLLRSKLVLGADTSVAAGPVGKGRAKSTDDAFKAEILSYSLSRGLFAGAELNGATIEQDKDTTKTLYGGQPDFRALLAGGANATPVPQRAEPFIATVQRVLQERAVL